MKRNVLIFFLVLYALTGFADKTKQALRALEKGDYTKVEEILLRSQAKDSANPATEYTWALLLTDTAYAHYNLDSAHWYILRASEHAIMQKEDYMEEMDDADIKTSDLGFLSKSIDSLAFVRAKNQNDKASYLYFMHHYVDANEIPQATIYYNHLVFEEVALDNTWQAYLSFLMDFPEALDFEKSKVKYHQLIYEEKTRSGRLADLERFLIDVPNTPFRAVLEQRIFEIKRGKLNPAHIMEFMTTYENSEWVDTAMGLLYHLEGFDFDHLSDLSIRGYLAFRDSVDQLRQRAGIPLVPMMDDYQYWFSDLKGKQFLSDTFEDIDFDYLCGNVTEDWLEVKVDNVRRVINRKGDIIFQGHTGDVTDEGNGILSIQKNGKYGLIHKSGFELLPFEYDSLKSLRNELFAYFQNEKWGVIGISADIKVDAVYDEIVLMEEFWVFRQGDYFGVTHYQNVSDTQDSANFKIDLRFEEMELINSDYIIGYEAEEEVLLNKALEVVSPRDTKRVNTRFDTWVFETELGFYLYDKDLKTVSNRSYKALQQNEEWLGLLKNGKWFVYNKNIYDEPIIGIDSLKLLGDDIAIIFRENSGKAIFPNKMFVEILEGEQLTSLGDLIDTDVHFLAVMRDGESILYKDGIEQFRYECDQLAYLSDSAFSVKVNGKYGVVGLDGRLIMRVRYDAIGKVAFGISPVLLEGHFGAYNFSDKILLKIDFDQKFEAYNDSSYLVKKDAKYGLMSNKNELIVDIEYSAIRYWSDSTFLGQKENNWSIVDMKTGLPSLSDVRYYEYLKDDPNQKILLIRKEEGYGVYHSDKGIIIPTVFHDIFNLGNESVQLYFTETAVPQADIYVVVYYDTNGERIKSIAYRGDEYDHIVCE